MRIWAYIKATTVSDIAEALQSFFPDMQNVDVAAHISVIQYLYKATPVEKDGMYIEVHYVPADDLNEEGYWTVSGKYPPGSEQYEGVKAKENTSSYYGGGKSYNNINHHASRGERPADMRRR